MAVIPVASKAGGPRDKLLTNTATGVLAAIRDHYLARMSALGHKRKWCYARVMSVLPLKADIRQREWHVRYVPLADIHAKPITGTPPTLPQPCLAAREAPLR